MSICLILALSLITGNPQIQFVNLRTGDQIRYPVALLRGLANDGRIYVVNPQDPSADGRNTGRVVNKRFRLLVELVPGVNHLRVSDGTSQASLDLVYKPIASMYKVNVIYLTASDGDTFYITQNLNDKQNYREKLDTAAKLMQTLTAESLNDSGFGRKTFPLDLDSSGHVRVRTLKYPATADQLRTKTGNELYDLIYPWLGKQGLFNHQKNIVVMAFSRYDPDTKRAFAHIAWGGGDMGLFSSLSMCGWPDSIRDVERAFSDSTPLDPKVLYDDSMGRSNMWGLASTGLGAVIHELGHTFVGAEHSGDPESIMSRGFDHFNRFFLPAEAPSHLDPSEFVFADGQVIHWDPYNASLLSCDRFFQPDPRRFQDDLPPRIYFDWDTNEIVAAAPNGIKLLHLWKQTDPPSHTVFKLFKELPKVIRFGRSELRDMLNAPEGAAIHITDGEGQVFSVNEGAYKTRADLPPITSVEYAAKLRKFVDGLHGAKTVTWSHQSDLRR
ncbi:MAG: hypothetical protein P4L46_11420 [Fimbriimonas sp.]|nr:hypothetical protein [Fimbriimonas sp.]